MWYGDTKRLSCEDCTFIYENNPPCAKCYPPVHEYNQPILELYDMVGDQYIMSGYGPVSVNMLAIGYALDNFYEEVINKRYFIDGVKYLVSNVISNIHETSKTDG